MGPNPRTLGLTYLGASNVFSASRPPGPRSRCEFLLRANQAGILIAGLADHPIEDLSLSNIFIDYAGGGTKEQGERVVEEYEKEYPEPGRFGTLPSWGLWVRHVKNFSASHVEFRAAKDDLRPVAILDDVTAASLDHVTLPAAGGANRLVLRNVNGVAIGNSIGLRDLHRDGRMDLDML